jgi:hypothetical protein
MASYEITNSLKQKTLIRIIGTGGARINLSQMAKNSGETVQSADIAIVSGVTEGVWKVYRGNDATGQLIFELPAFSNFTMTELDSAIANSATANVFVTNSGATGTLFVQMAKTSTFNPTLDTL